MSGLAWGLVGVLMILIGLAYAAWLMNMPLMLIIVGLAIALLILFLLVTRGAGRTSPVAEPDESGPKLPPPPGTPARRPPTGE